MGSVIFIGFFGLAALSLAALGYATGYYDALEKVEEQEYERKEKRVKREKEVDLTDRIRRITRRDKRIDYDLRSRE